MRKNFYRKILKNGMTVVFEKRPLPVVCVAFAVKSGGMHESPSEKGISHFVEHMLYKGTKKRTHRQIAEELEKNGGVINGFTDEPVTAFWCKLPSKKIDVALDVLSDMMKNSVFDEKEVNKERQVIMEEIKMNKDDPSRHVLKEMQTCLYKEPFSISPLGTPQSLGNIERKDLFERFSKFYRPNNLVLCVVGDTDFKKLVKFAEKTFGNEKAPKAKFKISMRNATKIEKRRDVVQANLAFGYHVPPSKTKKHYAALLLNTLMAEGLSSRLFYEIRQKRNLAYGISAYSDISAEFAYNAIYVGTRKDAVEEIRKIIILEFQKVSRELEEKELNQVKEQVVGNTAVSTEDSYSQMLNLLSYELEGNAEEAYNFEKNVRAVKISDVRKIAKDAAVKYSFFALVPE